MQAECPPSRSELHVECFLAEGDPAQGISDFRFMWPAGAASSWLTHLSKVPLVVLRLISRPAGRLLISWPGGGGLPGVWEGLAFRSLDRRNPATSGAVLPPGT